MFLGMLVYVFALAFFVYINKGVGEMNAAYDRSAAIHMAKVEKEQKENTINEN